LTESKTKPFWREKSFWKEGGVVDIQEFIEQRLDMHPSENQYKILWELAGRDPYEWDTTYQQYVFAIGQGGGKNTYIIAPFVIYCTYKIANMVNPHLYFSRFYDKPIDNATPFEIANHSMVTEKQARDVHFSKIDGLIRRCKTAEGNENWFERYVGLDLRSQFGDIKKKEITVPTMLGHGPIIHHSLDSTPTGFEGLNLIIDVIDEPSRADTAAGYRDVELLHKGVTGNLNTRFGHSVGKNIVFSYLNNSEWDYTWTLVQRAEEEKKHDQPRTIFAFVSSTFDMNPNAKKEDKDIAAAYRNDPSDAKARYECIKGSSKEGFYQPHTDKVRECFMPSESPVDYQYKVTERVIENPMTTKREVKRFIGIELTRIKGDSRPRGWAFDAATNYDAFVFKGGYIETMNEMRDELFVENRAELVTINKRPILDIVIVWQPKENLTVDYLNVGEVLGILLDKFPGSRFALSDKYNSEKLSHEIIARGVYSKTLGFSNPQQMKIYTKLRWMFWNNIPHILFDDKHEISRRGITRTVGEWNLMEHERLLRINNRVDHSIDGSKDFSDVDAILCDALTQLEVSIPYQEGAALSDTKMLTLAERFMIERQTLINRGEPPAKHLAIIAKTLGIDKSEAEKIKTFVESTLDKL